MKAPRIAVIGGGLSGLAAAVRLRELGATVSVLERESAVGGVVRTTTVDGWAVDAGPCMAAEPAEVVREFLQRAGVGDITERARPSAANRFIVHDGTPVEIPATTAEFASSSLLSLGGRLRLLKERFIPAEAPPEETVAAFARRRFGDEMAERMFDPLLASMSSGRADAILARFAFPAIVGHERGGASGLQGSARERMQARRRGKAAPKGSWSCRGGMQSLAKQLAANAGEVRFGVRVTAVDVRAEQVSISNADGPLDSFDGVIVALPAPAYAGLALHGVAGSAADQIRTLPCASVAAVSMGFAVAEVTRAVAGVRILIPSSEKRNILSIVIPGNAFGDRAPDGQLLLTAFVGGARQPELLQQSDADLLSLVRRELSDLLGITGTETFGMVTRWDHALPQAVRGHGERLEAAMAIERDAPILTLTGSWRDGLSVSEVLLGGMRAAERAMVRGGW